MAELSEGAEAVVVRRMSTSAAASDEPDKQQQQEQQAAPASEPMAVDDDPEEVQPIDEDQQSGAATEEDKVVAECTTEHAEQAEIRLSLSRCALCTKNFGPDDSPKLLECLHAACAACIANPKHIDAEVLPVDGNLILCEACDVTSQPENLIDNRFFAKLLEDDMSVAENDEPAKEEEEKKCTNCTENASATSWCVECEEFICQSCVMAHQKLKITKDHTIKPKEEATTNSENGKKREKKEMSQVNCMVHPHEHMSLFCQTCDRLTCRDCQLSDHRDHKYKFIHEIAEETRGSVRQLLNEVSYKRELLKSAMKVIEERQVLILEKKKTIAQDITKMIVDLTNAISSRGKQLVMRLGEVCDQKQNTLNEKKIALDQLSKLTDHCVDFVNYALDNGDDMELLYCKKSVTSHLQRIKNKRADIPNPEIPVRIHLSIEKVSDLIKVISSIGAIVVDGRVYPSNTPPLDSSASSNHSSEHVEQKQRNASTPNAAPEGSPVPQPISVLANQQSNMIPNAYMIPSMNIPISTHQQMTLQSQQQMVNPQMSAQNYMHYSTHTVPPHSSPQGQRMPAYNTNYNGRMNPQMMMAQRPGLGNCHSQVYWRFNG